jgi:hypothetical protein
LQGHQKGGKKMANPLSLFMPVIQGTSVAAVAGLIGQNQTAIDNALTSIGTVHYARFLVLDTTTPNLQPAGPADTNNLVLAVITAYDGDFNAYISDFVNQLGDVFNALLAHVQGGQALVPVQNNLSGFTAFIAKNDYAQMTGAPALYEAYPKTVQQILAS